MIVNKGLVLCFTPVFNDWESLNKLVDEIGVVFSESLDKKLKILAIYDGFTEQNKHPFNEQGLNPVIIAKKKLTKQIFHNHKDQTQNINKI